MKFATAFALVAATISSVIAQDTLVLGFNCGASDDKGNPKSQADFEKEFRTAKSLDNAPGNFSAIRLYSNIQWQTTDTPIAAFAAAIATDTRLLLGIWASGTNSIDNELKALNAAVEEHGTRLTDLIIGLSVGSEDLYRDSESGRRNKAGVGNTADAIIRFIKTTRERLAKTALSKIKITHVDTWTAWVNESNKAVVNELDFVSVNNFPFYQSEQDNKIANAAELMSSAIAATEAVAGGKDVWITETGWAYSGPAFGAAQATVDNAATYWREVGCALFGKYNVFWYTLRDANPANKVKFAITNDLSTKPRFNLACPERKNLPDAPPANLTDVINANSTSGNGNSQGTSGNNNTGAASSVAAHSTTMVLAVIFVVAIWAM
ncbi:glycoside hydrolase family 17 protein [Plenodomus tracheiphilus IPT5]|uniref:Glycoside hydrolase family 17 protein n=1 Tax=Plenodomus tracheiphilus IPT5 TaxID=1408161 RepID=A0A6A7BN33_9PLEO|nr:glycoside hydrolase family 17 protein [Plenodomus tracheiphilus IPT5]